MPAKSKKQQRLMGMVHAYKQGKLPGASPTIKRIAKHIKDKQAKDIAETSHKKLPEKVAGFNADPELWANKFDTARLEKIVSKLTKRGNRLKRQQQAMLEFGLGEPMTAESRPTFEKLLKDALTNKAQREKNQLVTRTMDKARNIRYETHPEELDKIVGELRRKWYNE